MTRQNEFRVWSSHFEDDFRYEEFVGLISGLSGVKSIDDVPDFAIWRATLGPVTRGVEHVTEVVTNFRPTSNNRDSQQRELQAIFVRHAWDLHEVVTDLIDQIDWHIQVISWTKFRNQPAITRRSILLGVAALIFSIGVAILSRVGWPDGSFLIDDSVNVFTVAIIWIGAVFALISLGASAEAMLTGRGGIYRQSGRAFGGRT